MREPDNEIQGHGYFSAEKFLVLAPVALAGSFHLIVGFTFGILAFIVPIHAQAYVSPGKPTGYVNDFAKVLSVTEKQSLETKLSALEKQTGDEVTVVTVPSLGGDTVENFAVKLFEEWGIGQKEKSNGLLILVSIEEHEIRLEVGYGLEGTVTDLQSGNIIRKVMAPAFKAGDYDAGIGGAVDAITEIITGSPDALQYSETQTSSSNTQSKDWSWIFFAGFVLLNIGARLLGRTKSWWLGGVIGAGLGAVIGLIWGFFLTGIISIIVLTLLGLLFDFLVSKGGGGGAGGLWLGVSGGRGGSGGGGGFGGFGGGMSGGGGASGKW